jgi:hypothetical protein
VTDRAGWHSAAVAAVLAALQSTNLLFLYLIVRELAAGASRPRTLAVVLVALGAASSIFLLQLGSTFVDPMTTPLVMAAVWLVMRRGDPRALFFAGMLCGAAAALKLTNAPFAVGLLAATLSFNLRWVEMARSLLGASFGVAVGFLTLYGYWGWRLAELHGSPVFPLFNNLFRSPDFAEHPVSFQRFVPQTVLDALTLPFRMIEHRSWVYAEVMSPDLRPGLLVVLAILAAGLAGWRARYRTQADAMAMAAPWNPEAHRRLVVFFVVATVAWMATSGNGRYATPLLLLLAPLIYTTGARLLGVRAAALMCLMVLPAQVLFIVDAGNPRWAPSDWTARWIPVSVPAGLAQAPQLYVSTSVSSESYIAAHVHPDSVFVNPIGLSPIATGGPGWARFEALRDRFVGRVQVLFLAPTLASAEERAQYVAAKNASIDRLGLAIEPGQCEYIVVNQAEAEALPYLWGRIEGRVRHARTVAACAARPAAPSARLAALRAQAAAAFDAIERKCPDIFAPNGVQVEGTGRRWSRNYTKFDLFISLDYESGDIFYRLEHQGADVLLGNRRTWEEDVRRFRCRLPHDGRRDISTLAGDEDR